MGFVLSSMMDKFTKTPRMPSVEDPFYTSIHSTFYFHWLKIRWGVYMGLLWSILPHITLLETPKNLLGFTFSSTYGLIKLVQKWESIVSQSCHTSLVPSLHWRTWTSWSEMILTYWMMVERYSNLKEEVVGSISGCEISSLPDKILMCGQLPLVLWRWPVGLLAQK